MATVARANGWFDEIGDRDWFAMNLVAGQRYYLEMLGGALGDQRALMSLFGPRGNLMVNSAELIGARLDTNGFAFVAPESGTFTLQTQARTTIVGVKPLPAVPYSIALAQIGADDHGDLPTIATALSLGTEVAARFDLTRDVDMFAAELQAGQRVLFEATAVGQTVITFLTSLSGPRGNPIESASGPSTGSQVKYLFTAPEAGRYTWNLVQRTATNSPDAPANLAYTVKLSAAEADDRPDLTPAPLAIGATAAGVLDGPGDVDAMRVDLVAGNRYQFDLLLPQSAGLNGQVRLRLTDGAGVVLREGSAAPSVFLTMGYEPEVSGSYLLQVDAVTSLRAASLGSGAYQVVTRQLAADDVPGRFAAALPIEIDLPRSLRFDSAGDVDMFRFNATAGQRYLVTVADGNGVPAPAYVQIVAKASDLNPKLFLGTLEANPIQDGRVAGRGDITPEASGPMTLVISPRPTVGASGVDPNTVYTVQLAAMAADDHSDARAFATPLQPGQVLTGKLDFNGDTDWFRADLNAGWRYLFDISVSDSDRARGLQPSLELVRADGSKPAQDANPAALPQSRFVFTSETTGSYYLSPRQVVDYKVSLISIGPDDQPDTRPASTVLLANPAYVASGFDLRGSDAAENFVGSSFVDRFFGEGGNDVFFGGAGDDVIDGGSGVDMARFSGLRGDYSLLRGPDGLRVQDSRGRDGSDLLSGIERLGFLGQPNAIALDLEGNAGAVARTIGALFGKSWLERPDIVGIGLGLMDRGMGFADLVQLAVGTDLFMQLAGSRSNADFVRHVYTNVVGRAPTPSDLVFYTNLLDIGSYTQASLGLAAAQTINTAAMIDLTGLAANGLSYLPGG